MRLDYANGYRLSVRDSGQGIEPRFLPHVFEPFRQADGSASREHGGLGLGLAIARQLIEMHGGTIEARSEGKGMGATFEIFLPSVVPTRPADSGGAVADVFDMDGYIASRTPFFAENDFFEIEIARREFRFGAIAHVLSFYEGRKSPDGEIVKRGVNSIQLFHDGDRWWVVSMLWDNAPTEVKLPE